MRSATNHFLHSLWHGAATAGLLGGVGAAVVGGVVALFGGPAIGAAAVAAGIFGLIGAAGSALDAATAGRGDYRASWTSGIPTTALMVAGILALGGDKPAPDTKPTTSPTALTQSFKTASSTASAVSCVPSTAYPRSNVTSKGPTAHGG